MTTVTRRIKSIKQPYGGYLKPSEFQEIEFQDGEQLQEENISPILVGTVVDYLTRFMLNNSPEDAFKISLLGAKLIKDEAKALKLLKNIKGIDDNSIYSACKLVGYDVCYRSGPIGYKSVDEINADNKTINNIRIMIKRSLTFFEKYGPITLNGFKFEGGYTDIINDGDGDFLTQDTLWDFKVSSNKPTSNNTLQILIYYIMGIHSIHPEFKNINNIGIFNPRLNIIYLKAIKDIPKEIIEIVSSEIIGYKNNNNDDILSVTEIMKILKCTRYKVMKYYAEKDLPLFKMNNKYYISKTKLKEWIDEQERIYRYEKIVLIICILWILLCFFIILLRY